MEKRIPCDYWAREGSNLVCRITGLKVPEMGKLAQQCPVDDRNECARRFVEENGFERRRVLPRLGREG